MAKKIYSKIMICLLIRFILGFRVDSFTSDLPPRVTRQPCSPRGMSAPSAASAIAAIAAAAALSVAGQKIALDIF